jgi:hypothetical protein
MCGKIFSNITMKVRDHCHLCGKFRFTLCSACNFTFAKQHHKIYVFFHGLTNYDSHFLIQKLHKFNEHLIHVIPRNSEKYLSFSVGNLIFKDTFQFLSESLAKLVTYLHDKGEKYFHYVLDEFPNSEQNCLLFRKGVFPYSFFNKEEILKNTCLPSKNDFFNDLTNEHISEEDYLFALKVWKIFNCKTFQDYLEIYLVADCLLLSDVFENFRTECLNNYQIDPVFYYSCAHFTMDAFLK